MGQDRNGDNSSLTQKLDDAELDLKVSEAELNRAEGELKRRELDNLEHPLSLRNVNPVVVALIAALLGFIGNLVSASYQGRNALN